VIRWCVFNDRASALAATDHLQPAENVELARSIYAAWERGDYSSVDWAHPEIEYVRVDGPEPGRWTGLDEMADAWRSTLAAWEGLRVEGAGYRELDDERVLVFAHWSGRGKTSGVELEQMSTEGASLFHISGGKVTKLVLYWDGARALADLGLAEQDAHA
jgi:ketosteroid isomerase-like protein